MQAASLLVTGVSGHLGHRMATTLLHATTLPLIGTTRTPARVADLSPGMTLRAADFSQPDGLPDAFAGAARMLLTSLPAETAGPLRVARQRHAIDAARQAGVRHIVYTSFLATADGPLAALAADHVETEATLCATGGATALRNAWYAEMLLTTLPRSMATGVLRTLDRHAGVAWIARDDCAVAAAAALRGEGDGRPVYQLTGPQAVTPLELAETANAVLGASIKVLEFTPEAMLKALLEDGVAEPMARLLLYIEQGLAKRAMAETSGDFGSLTGQRSAGIDQFLETHRDALLQAADAAQ
ncbi:NAD(P)H-binding protein [Cupriavidus sp. SIMBA_020]|uniref:NAD(P)H-binding protein n=1 Tax=Cupriavidus sp. SIMBA_020 TaxID=3085766 RepID=UPI00397869BD